jgi:Xaa-Pro aminopeptidase
MNHAQKIQKAQKYLREMKLDGWLLYDFFRANDIVYQFLEFPDWRIFRRRFFYWIPAVGQPVKIVHAIETHTLDEWPGPKKVFLSWQTLHEELGAVLKGKKRVAMEYSPKNLIPYVSKVDGGMIDLVRSFGVEVVSSADFLPYFTSVMDERQAKSHIRAGKELDRIAGLAWKWIAKGLRDKKKFAEYDVQQMIMREFKKKGLVTDGPPDVSVNANTADPHYLPTKEKSSPIRKGDFIILDLWCKEADKRAVFADITRVGVAAKRPTQRQEEIFHIVHKAQKDATDFVVNRFKNKKRVEGWEVDDVARKVIQRAGYGDKFLHRTGHSIDMSLHGSGAHLDNIETHDVRPILPGTCFSVEPGIYLEGEFGVRLEYDLYVDLKGKVRIVGGVQNEIVCLLP